jgi:glucan 1,3-beta-glucosidase
MLFHKYSCLSNLKKYNWNIQGTSLGGLFVIEPWITPSLFYQFLNQKNPNKIAMDMYTFCQVLGPIEGKKQLNQHFWNWVNETDIQSLAKKKITHIRIPIGDWMFQPYGPYIGCTENSLFHLNRILDLCQKYSLQVLLDLHGVIDSQNGFDNSGRSMNVEFIVGTSNNNYNGTINFIHWNIIAGNWAGTFDTINKKYINMNYHNINFTKKVLYQIIDTYKNYDAVFGIEPLNEPSSYIPENILKDFYYDIYHYMYVNAPHLTFIYHNSFRDNIWHDFLINCSNVAMDWHIYQAWNRERYGDQFLLEADGYTTYIENFKKQGIEIVVGEYSLATDNCALWLNGFQDNLDTYPVTPCKYAPCPFPYIDVNDFDRVSNIISPFGTGLSAPYMGTCPYEGNIVTYEEHFDFLHKLNQKKLKSFSHSQGWFFWNFKTEYKEEITWSFESSFDNKLFKGTTLDNSNDYSLLNYSYYFIGFLFFIFIFLGMNICIDYFCNQKNKINKYEYVNIELTDSEKNPINILKKNASTGDIYSKNKYNYYSI